MMFCLGVSFLILFSTSCPSVGKNFLAIKMRWRSIIDCVVVDPSDTLHKYVQLVKAVDHELIYLGG